MMPCSMPVPVPVRVPVPVPNDAVIAIVIWVPDTAPARVDRAGTGCTGLSKQHRGRSCHARDWDGMEQNSKIVGGRQSRVMIGRLPPFDSSLRRDSAVDERHESATGE
jgi:hypothetical protein